MTSLAEVIDDTGTAVNKVWSSDKAGIELDLITTVQEVAANTTASTPKVYGTSLVIVNAATATITLPSDAPVGGRVHVKKIHATQGAIIIARAGTDTITRAGLTSVDLNADGDHWLLQKVSATRWELVGGTNTGTNVNGEWTKYANGDLVCTYMTSSTVSSAYNNVFGSTAGAMYRTTTAWAFPMTYISTPKVMPSAATYGTVVELGALTTTGVNAYPYTATNGSTIVLYFTATGRWF